MIVSSYHHPFGYGVGGCQPPRPPEGGVTQRDEVSTRAIDGKYSTYNRKDTNMMTTPHHHISLGQKVLQEQASCVEKHNQL